MTAARPGTENSKITPRQQTWSSSPAQRVKLAEILGEEGAWDFAAQKGWQPLFDGSNRTFRQGLDQVYQSGDGAIHVIEAKGGRGQLGHAYGYQQGTPQWAVKSAERMLQNPAASAAESIAAKAVLVGAVRERLEVHVVQTRHKFGEPGAPALRQSLRSTEEAGRLAATAIETGSRIWLRLKGSRHGDGANSHSAS